jgi:hypothetical protein
MGARSSRVMGTAAGSGGDAMPRLGKECRVGRKRRRGKKGTRGHHGIGGRGAAGITPRGGRGGATIAASGRRDNRGADTGSARGLGRIVRGGGGGQNLAPLVLWTSTLLSYRVEEMWDSVSVVLPPSRSL